MNRGIYATATGMNASLHYLDVISNNLANASTVGYKRDDVAFNDAMIRELRSNGGSGDSLGSIGSGSELKQEVTVMSKGSTITTGNPLDVAIESPTGMFAIETAQGVRYSRDGRFQLDNQRQLVTATGERVLDDGLRPIQLSDGEVQIGADGSISVDGLAAARLGVYTGDFQKLGANLYLGVQTNPVLEPNLQPGAVEASNVQPIEEMVQMIRMGRAFEFAQKSISTQDELTQRLIQSLQDR